MLTRCYHSFLLVDVNITCMYVCEYTIASTYGFTDQDQSTGTECGLRVAGCGLRVAGCGLRVAGCGLRVTAKLYETFRTKLDPKAASNHRKSKTMVFKRLVFHALHRNLGAVNQKQTSTNRLSSAEIARIVDAA